MIVKGDISNKKKFAKYLRCQKHVHDFFCAGNLVDYFASFMNFELCSETMDSKNMAKLGRTEFHVFILTL